MSDDGHETNERRARRRALRAAQVVTLGLALAGCSASHDPPPPMPEMMSADAGPVWLDAGAPEDAAMADAGVNCNLAEDWTACCDENAWDAEAGCLAWGPYVPPGATMPESRSGRA